MSISLRAWSTNISYTISRYMSNLWSSSFPSFYQYAFTITSKSGNNIFSYNERTSRIWKATITIPSYKCVSSIDQIKLWNKVVLEEIDTYWVMQSCTWLEHLYHLQKTWQDTYIMDNHNHALYYWTLHTTTHFRTYPTWLVHLYHIDQHSDLATPVSIPSCPSNLNTLWKYVNLECQIGTFIKPFLSRFPQTSFEWIKSEYQLLHHSHNTPPDNKTFTIVDVDIDFRAPEMSITNHKKTQTIVKTLLSQADLITIATSPLFIDQQAAIDTLHTLLE